MLSFVCRCVAVLSEEFCAQTSLLCSALALRRGTSRRFERLVWASLHLSERSRTIEVRVATLSAQTCTKSLTQSYYFRLSNYLLFPVQSPKTDRAARIWTSRHKNIRQRFAVGYFLSVLAVEASVFCAGANHRPRRSIPLGLSERRGEAPA